MIFQKAENQTAYLKVGILGFSGSGKTYTAVHLAKGIADKLKTKKPVFFLDSETGSDYFVDKFKSWEIPLYVAKTRTFVDLLSAVQEAEKMACVLIIDSISHFWKETQDAYLKAMGRKRLLFQDWLPIKSQWQKYTDAYINSKIHIVMCGRAGYEYDFFIDESGSRQLEKTGTKMGAEKEMAFEPSLLLEMERARIANPDKKTVAAKQCQYVCHVLKDRSDLINGRKFINPTFKDFEPVFNFLNIGGEHLGIDTSKDSSGLFTKDAPENFYEIKKKKDICLEEIQGELLSVFPGRSSDEQKLKADFIYDVFGTRSWTALGDMDLEKLTLGRMEIKIRLEKYKLEQNGRKK